MVQVSKRLVVRKEIPLDESKDLINSLDVALAEHYCRNKEYEKGLNIFRELLQNTCGPEKSAIVQKYIGFSLQYANNMCIEKKYVNATEIYRDIMKYSGFPITVYKNIGLCMKQMGNADMAIKFLKRFEELSPDKEDVYVYLADITYSDIKDNLKAIEYYEKALPRNKNNFSLYNMLGHLYSTCYQDKFKDKQIYYLSKAFELSPQNRIVVKNLAYVYGKFDEVEKADEFYAKLMYLNPTHSDLHAYGAYLVKHKRFSEGFKFLQHRFQKEDLGNIAFPPIFASNKKKRWNMKLNTMDKNLLIHFEQGFGDSIMLVRYIEETKKLCKKLTLVVQDGLVDLFKDSNLGIEIYTEKDLPHINYDLYIPMMDLPILCNTQPDTIPKAEGYLQVPNDKVKEYAQKYILPNKNFKIGIAFEGTLAGKETDRDIPLEYMYDLMRLPNVDVYSFQVDDLSNQMDRIPDDAKLIRLGKTFKNWEDTACAIQSMDLMITTDNGVMNLSGALGHKTFGLFNRLTEWRWFKVDGDDIAWYKTIKPFQAPTSKAWDVPMAQVMEEVKVLAEEKMNPKKKTTTKKTAKPKTITKKTAEKTTTKAVKKTTKTTSSNIPKKETATKKTSAKLVVKKPKSEK